MGYKKLISPEFRVTVGDYEVTDGIEVECFSSKESHMDWCRVELSPQLQGVLKFKDMDEASVELGYEDDFDSLIDGYVRCGDTDYWKEIMIKDDMMKLDRVTIKASFVDCEPQDVIRYVLACAGIEDYVLSDEHYGKKDLFVIDRKSGINTIAEVNSSWGIKNPFFFQKKVFYWGTKEEQKEIYVLEEGETILSLNKYGDLWEAETIAIPWIHHSQEVEVQHSKYSGIVTVEKTIVRSDDTGAVHMYIYFAGGEKDPHMQYPPGLYAKVVSVRQNGELYEATLKILDKNKQPDIRFPEVPKVKTDIPVLKNEIVAIVLMYGECKPYIIGRCF